MGLDNNHFIKIQYVIKIPEVNGSVSLTWPNRHDERFVRVAEIITAITKLQKDIAEIYCDKEFSIRNRMRGIVDGYFIKFIKTFDEIREDPYFIKIVLSDEQPEFDLLNSGVIFLFFGEASNCKDGQFHYKSFTPDSLKKKVLDLISALDGPGRKVLDELKSLVGFEREYKRLDYPLIVSTGFYNRPLIAVLESLRVHVESSGIADDYRENEICLLVNLIDRIRRHISDRLGVEGMSAAVSYYFTDASSSLDFAKARSRYTEASLRSRGIENPQELIAAIRFSDRGQTISEYSENPYIAQLQQERLLLDGLIVLAAANDVAPVIRTPLTNNHIYSQVSNLAAVDRNSGTKTNAMMRRLRELFAPHLNCWLEYLDSSSSSAIKLVSNLPIEWAFHQGLPLMIRHEVSRIPVTPGYVAARLLLDSNNVHLSLEDFREILFISSFADNDPIRNDLRDSLLHIKNLVGFDEKLEIMKSKGLIPADFSIQDENSILDVRINWIDVANKADLVSAINNNPCAITVFDLHGSHSESGAFIHLKDEAVSVFDIYQEIRISPIVILSSCDTSPVDKGHESTAEAFFLAGAKTLISSALPIQSDLASTFLARLLVRIKTYLPERVLIKREPIRWSTFISGMIRRTYYYELVSLLQKELRFDSEKKKILLFKIGRLIDPLSQDWVQGVRNEIMTQLKIDAKYLDLFVANKAQFLECMKYLQLGRPESIIISADGRY